MTDIEKLADMIRNHHRIVFFGGAGVSTESDIPDFRGANGLYRQKTDLPWTPEEMLSHHFFEEHPVEFFTNYASFTEAMLNASPNRAHYVLADWERKGKLSAVVTQNIDGLHQRAGSRNVLELHGSVLRNYCIGCGKSFTVDKFLSLCHPVPHCPVCGGIIKPDVVLYEEPLDMDTMQDAMEAIQEADMLIIGGTSLVVYPAAGFIDYFTGDSLVMINRDETAKDSSCDLVFHDSIGKVLDEAAKMADAE
ncbi:NAD-dependent protein deacylase [uncultured Dialister sp.]|mgnify:CR=1 FL=1|jgi:NAD-dependent deacetylase|uniref:NAD-dependent protein deacylase n=1 Tax=uncultured Dialister sp. TaxID=278064 RepID=UPI0025DDD168|nr:NAD-dependent protein deacylase [uncultured Dialister sp.]